MADWCLKITLDAWFFYRTERRGGEEVKSKDHLSCTIRGYLFFFFSFLQPFTGGESQIVSLWADEGHFSLTFRQEGRVPWQKQCIAMVKETDPAWSQNWLLPATVPLVCPSPVWGQHLVLSHPEPLRDAPLGVALVVTGLERKKVWVPQSCLTLCHPMNCSPAGSSVLGIFQARILE